MFSTDVKCDIIQNIMDVVSSLVAIAVLFQTLLLFIVDLFVSNIISNYEFNEWHFFKSEKNCGRLNICLEQNINRDHSLCTQNNISFDGNQHWSQRYYAQFPVCNVVRLVWGLFILIEYFLDKFKTQIRYWNESWNENRYYENKSLDNDIKNYES